MTSWHADPMSTGAPQDGDLVAAQCAGVTWVGQVRWVPLAQGYAIRVGNAPWWRRGQGAWWADQVRAATEDEISTYHLSKLT